MRVDPPAQLVRLLEQLSLATSTRVQSMYGRVRRLAKDLPLFESVWVDALAQARVLTAFQAAEINAGRGESLAIGPYVLCQRLADRGYAEEFVARQRDHGERVRMYRIACATARDAEQLERRLSALVARTHEVDADCLLPLTDCGQNGRVAWAVCGFAEGRTAAQWMAHNGRFPPSAALEIARQLAPGMVVLEKIGLAHADLAPQNLTITSKGQVLLHAPGLREAVRPLEGYAQADLPPEAFDYLAPERSAEGLPADACSDRYSWGCVNWHLLTGRPPFQGGTSLAKLRAAQVGRIPPVGRLAPETAPELSKLIGACASCDRHTRLESFVRAESILGASTRAGRAALAACMSQSTRPNMRLQAIEVGRGKGNRTTYGMAATAACLLLVAVLVWPTWKQRLPLAHIRGTQAVVDVAEANANQEQSNESVELRASVPKQDDLGKRGGNPRPAPSISKEELLLPVDRPIALERLDVRGGQVVRGMGGKRPLISLPSEGLKVDVEGVRFVDVDFVWDHLASSSRLARPAMMRVAAHRIEFLGCSFQAPQGLKQPAALLWQLPPATAADRLALPSSKVQLTNCVFSGVGVGIDSDTSGALLIEANNVLHLGPGPFLRFTRCQRVDEPILMTLTHVTLRGASALIAWQYDQLEPQPGAVSVRAVESAFAPTLGCGLIDCEGLESPERLLRSDALERSGIGPGPSGTDDDLAETARGRIDRGRVRRGSGGPGAEWSGIYGCRWRGARGLANHSLAGAVAIDLAPGHWRS